MINPSDIDKTLGEVLEKYKKETSFNFTFNAVTKRILGNSLLLSVSSVLFNYAHNFKYENEVNLIGGFTLLTLLIGYKLGDEFKSLKFVDDFCKRRGLDRLNFREYESDMGYNEELLNKKIKNFDITEEKIRKPKKP